MEKYLDEFIDLANTCNFQETAFNFYISQSSLSKHIKALEKEWDTTLFDRSTRAVKLSPSGEIFLEYAKEMTTLQKKCISDLQKEANKSKQSKPVVRIGAPGFFHYYDLIYLLGQFQDEHPENQYNYMEADDDQLVALMRDGVCRFGFTSTPQLYNFCDSRVFAEDTMYVALSGNHPLAQYKEINPDMLEDCDFITHTPMKKYDFFWQFSETVQYKPHVVESVGYNSSILQLVSLNRGIAVLSHRQTLKRYQEEVPNVLYIPIKPAIKVNAYVIWPKSLQLHESDKVFLNYFSHMTASV